VIYTTQVIHDLLHVTKISPVLIIATYHVTRRKNVESCITRFLKLFNVLLLSMQTFYTCKLFKLV